MSKSSPTKVTKRLEMPWFGVTKEAGKYSIISIPVYDDFEVAKQECKRVNKILEDCETKGNNG